MDSGKGDIANTDLEGKSACLAGVISLCDVADVARGINPWQVIFAAQYVDQQLDHSVAHRLLAGAMAEPPLLQLVVHSVSALDPGRLQHHSCCTGAFADAVLRCSRLSVEHNRAITLALLTR